MLPAEFKAAREVMKDANAIYDQLQEIARHSLQVQSLTPEDKAAMSMSIGKQIGTTIYVPEHLPESIRDKLRQRLVPIITEACRRYCLQAEEVLNEALAGMWIETTGRPRVGLPMADGSWSVGTKAPEVAGEQGAGQ